MAEALLNNTTHYATNINPAQSTEADVSGAINDWDCGFDDLEHCELLRQIKIIAHSIAIIFGIITLVLLILLRKYRYFRERIFMYIIIPNLLNSINKTVNDGYDNNICALQAFIAQVTGFNSFLWVCVITIYLARLIIPGEKRTNLDSRERLCIALCFGVPFIGAFLPLATDDYGPAGVYCGIITTTTGKVWRYLIWYGPVGLGICASVITFIVIYYWFLRMYRAWSETAINGEQTRQQQLYKESILKTLGPFTAYAVAFFVLFVIHFVSRTHEISSPAPSLTLKIIHRIASPCYDIIICIVFYVTNGKSEFYKREFRNSIGHHKKNIRREIFRRKLEFDPTIAEGPLRCDPASGKTNTHPMQPADDDTTVTDGSVIYIVPVPAGEPPGCQPSACKEHQINMEIAEPPSMITRVRSWLLIARILKG